MKIRIFALFIVCILTHAAVAQDQALDDSPLDLPSYIFATNDSQDEPTLFVPDQLATLTSDAHQLIGGILSPLSGNLCLREVNLTAIGAQEIQLHRMYIAPYMPYLFHKHWDEDCYSRWCYLESHYEGWKHFPHLRLWINEQNKEVHLANSNGAAYDFSIADGKTTLLHPYASSNIGDQEIPGGRFDPKNTRNWLIAVELRDGEKRLFLQKSYEYDGYGNPIIETFKGDLTGTGSEESYKIKREFSQDGRNLLIREETEEGKVTIFKYLPNTNLITQKNSPKQESAFLPENL